MVRSSQVGWPIELRRFSADHYLLVRPISSSTKEGARALLSRQAIPVAWNFKVNQKITLICQITFMASPTLKFGRFASLTAALVCSASPSLARGAFNAHVPFQSRTALHFLQCVPFARQLSGIRIFGDARTWWNQAQGRYLRSFPFDKIKIDKSFIDSITSDTSAMAIVRAIVVLASSLEMETTAEGVEDSYQLAELRGQGCTSVQGYYFSRPIDNLAALALVGRDRVIEVAA